MGLLEGQPKTPSVRITVREIKEKQRTHIIIKGLVLNQLNEERFGSLIENEKTPFYPFVYE